MNSETGIIGSSVELSAQGVVEVVVPDLKAALTFYRRVGFIVERETPTFVALKWGDVLLFLAENGGAPIAPRWTSIRILVNNVDAIWQHVQLNQLPVGNPIGDRPYGLRDFTVRDPGGFGIRFAQTLV